MRCLIVPGLNGSGPDHWQSRWEAERDDCVRAQLGDWDDPTRLGWIARLGSAISNVDDDILLVAHSLGCLAVAWWAGIAPDRAAKITAALLVAPPDVDRPGADPRLQRFAPAPRQPLPFPAILVASRNDPYAGFARSRDMARDWSARIHDAGEAGHINADSGVGGWREGYALVDALIDEAGGHRREGARRFGGYRR